MDNDNFHLVSILNGVIYGVNLVYDTCIIQKETNSGWERNQELSVCSQTFGNTLCRIFAVRCSRHCSCSCLYTNIVLSLYDSRKIQQLIISVEWGLPQCALFDCDPFVKYLDVSHEHPLSLNRLFDPILKYA